MFQTFWFLFSLPGALFPQCFLAHSSLYSGVCSIGTLPDWLFLTNQYKISHHLFSLTLIFYLTFVRLHIHFLICYCLSNPLEFKFHENRKLLCLPPPLPTLPHPHLQCLEQHLALGSTQWLFGERVSEWMNEWMRLPLIFIGFCYGICLSISSTFFKILSTSAIKHVILSK